jgi:hypothetical protein
MQNPMEKLEALFNQVSKWARDLFNKVKALFPSLFRD